MREMHSSYRHLTYFLLALPALMIAGFWIPYLGQFPKFDESKTAAVHLHAIALFSWIALLVVQPIAIKRGAYSVHRWLGRVTYLLVPLIILLSIAMIRKEYHENLLSGQAPMSALKSEYLNCGQLILLAGFYAMALGRIFKRDVPAHMRFILCAALVVMPAGLARTLGFWFGFNQVSSQSICLLLIDAILIALIVFDTGRRFAAKPFVAALLVYIVYETGWLGLGRPV
jgi:hypothetical protein